jgi:hypothetical protein
MEQLAAEEVEAAAPQFLEATLLDELLAAGKLPATWPALIIMLREWLGLTVHRLGEDLHDLTQAKGETLSQFAARFEL